MNQDKPRKMTDEQRAQRRRAALECTNNLNGSDSHYCPRCASAQQAAVAPQAACADKRIKLYPGDVVRALDLGTRKKDFDADELLGLLRKLRDGAVTDSNRIGELSTALSEMTGKYNAALEGKNCEAEHNQELRGQAVNLIDERDKAQEYLRKALAERNQARAAFRALAQRMTFDELCNLLLNWGTDQ